MKRIQTALAILAVILTASMTAVLFRCSSGNTDGGNDTGTGDSTTDEESDNTDSETETDSDSDSDSDSDDDTDSDTDGCIHPEVVADCKDGWCAIPPGCFMLGSPSSEICRGAYSETQAQVTLTRPFLIKQTEVTREEWVSVGFPDPSYGSEDMSTPVNVINWFDAVAYCNKLSEAEGLETCYDLTSCQGEVGSGCPEPEPFECVWSETLFYCDGPVRKFPSLSDCPGYRLPTTAEWEYAARAGSTTAMYNGKKPTMNNSDGCVSDPPVDPIAWHCGNTSQVMPVGLKEPNGWYLYDMLGNVGEWSDYVYTGLGLPDEMGSNGPFIDPIGADENVDLRRSVRGNFFIGIPCLCRAAEQFGDSIITRSNFYGVRPVRTIFAEAPNPKLHDVRYSVQSLENNLKSYP